MVLASSTYRSTRSRHLARFASTRSSASAACGVGRTDLEEALVGALGPRVVEHLFVENPRQLGEQLPFPRAAARAVDLDLQQLRDRFGLAPPFVGATRGLEEPRELFAAHAGVAADFFPQLLPGLAQIRVVLKPSECALDGLRAHPSPAKLEVEAPPQTTTPPPFRPVTPRKRRQKRTARNPARKSRPKALPCYGGDSAIARAGAPPPTPRPKRRFSAVRDT